jgi:ribosomal protein RSM22 (predicted rRNA methylase)
MLSRRISSTLHEALQGRNANGSNRLLNQVRSLRTRSSSIVERAVAPTPTIPVSEDESLVTMSFKDLVGDLKPEDIRPREEVLIGPQLLSLARRQYKKLEELPSWLLERRKIIALMRTNNQKRGVATELLKKIPSHNYDLQLLYRNRLLGWKYSKEPKKPPLVEYGPSEVVVYSDMFLPGRYLITKKILTELKERLPSFHPKKVLDFGCGPSTAYAAVLETWGGKENPKGMHKYTGIDSSQAMLDAAKIITHGGPVDCVYWNKTADLFHLAKSRGDRFDLIVVSYTLSEMPSDAMRAATVQLMTELLNIGGHLVIIESGNPQGSHTVRSARQFVLDIFNILPNRDEKGRRVKTFDYVKNPPKQLKQGEQTADGTVMQYMNPRKNPVNSSQVERKNWTHFVLPPPELKGSDVVLSRRLGHFDFGATVIAPCTHDKVCPLGDGVWCSFALKVIDKILL